MNMVFFSACLPLFWWGGCYVITFSCRCSCRCRQIVTSGSVFCCSNRSKRVFHTNKSLDSSRITSGNGTLISHGLCCGGMIRLVLYFLNLYIPDFLHDFISQHNQVILFVQVKWNIIILALIPPKECASLVMEMVDDPFFYKFFLHVIR